jgi:hypothetical protein
MRMATLRCRQRNNRTGKWHERDKAACDIPCIVHRLTRYQCSPYTVTQKPRRVRSPRWRMRKLFRWRRGPPVLSADSLNGFGAVAEALADLPPSGLSSDPCAASVLIGSRALTHWIPSRAAHDWDVVMSVEAVRHWLKATDSRLFTRIQLVVHLPIDLDVDTADTGTGADTKSSTGPAAKAAEPMYAVNLNGFCADGGSCRAPSPEADSSAAAVARSTAADSNSISQSYAVRCLTRPKSCRC